MTHDELLERLDELKYDVGDSGMNEEYKAIYVLRAVVEQAQPMLYKYKELEGDDRFIDGWNLAMRLVKEAIEKELK